MREIKFRAWSKIKKTWLNSIVIGDNGVPLIFYVTVLDDGRVINNVYTVDNLEPIIQQYTGLKDKNGRPIYDGDILEEYYEGEDGNPYMPEYTERGEVYYSDMADFRVKTKKDSGVPLFDWNGVIIGNVCESPELLK